MMTKALTPGDRGTPTPEDELSDLRRDWNQLADMDALWAINSRRDKKFSRWTVEEFLETGVSEVGRILYDSDRLGRPRSHQMALDFGCGVGRLSRHLASHFHHVEGIDISERMVTIGRKINRNIDNLTLTVNPYPDLRIWPAESFDLVCSIIVLQHIPEPKAIERYIGEFIRVLRPHGLLAIQLPTALPKIRRLLARRTPYIVLRGLGLPPAFLYFHLGLHPMHMTALPEGRVTDYLQNAGATVLDIVKLAENNNLYYATR